MQVPKKIPRQDRRGIKAKPRFGWRALTRELRMRSAACGVVSCKTARNRATGDQKILPGSAAKLAPDSCTGQGTGSACAYTADLLLLGRRGCASGQKKRREDQRATRLGHS